MESHDQFYHAASSKRIRISSKLDDYLFCVISAGISIISTVMCRQAAALQNFKFYQLACQ
jgi:hypothetical protein